MFLVVDTHIHYYPLYRREVFIYSLFQNLAGHNNSAVNAAFLIDSLGYDAWSLVENFEDLPCLVRRDDACLRIKQQGYGELLLFTGKQIVTREGVELLALFLNKEIKSGLAIYDTITKITDMGGIPVLPWSPGKWLFTRGKIVRNLINEVDPGKVLIGDTSLRPSSGFIPSMFRLAKHKGFKIVCGTDPLPVKGEEKLIGSYASVVETDFDMAKPVESMRSCLLDPDTAFDSSGERGSWLNVTKRILKHSFNRKKYLVNNG